MIVKSSLMSTSECIAIAVQTGHTFLSETGALVLISIALIKYDIKYRMI